MVLQKKRGISTDIIGESMGHTDSKTTEISLAEFDNEVLDKANTNIP
jgi:hypothetical protein